MQLASKEVSDRGEVSDGFRSTDLPLAVRVSQDRLLSPHLRKVDHAQLRELRSQLFEIGIVGSVHAPLHVGLTGADPDFANKNILKCLCFIRRNRQCLRRAIGHHFRQTDDELSIRIGLSGDGLSRHFHGDIVARLRPAPDLNGHLLLDNHVVAEDVGHFEFSLS